MKRLLPESVLIGPHRLEVREVPQEALEDKDSVEDVEIKESLIQILETLPDSQKIENLLHSIFHTILDFAGFEWKEFDPRAVNSEHVTQILGFMTMTVFSNNPELCDLLKKFGESREKPI